MEKFESVGMAVLYVGLIVILGIVGILSLGYGLHEVLTGLIGA